MTSKEMMNFLAHKITNEHLHNIMVGIIESTFKPINMSDVAITIDENGDDIEINVSYNSVNFGNFVSQSGFKINKDNVANLYHKRGLYNEVVTSSINASIQTIDEQLSNISYILKVQTVQTIIKNIESLKPLIQYFDLVDEESQSVLSFVHYITKLMEYERVAIDLYENPSNYDFISISPKMGCDILGVQKGNGLFSLCPITTEIKFKNINRKLLSQLLCNTIRSIDQSKNTFGRHAMICTSAFLHKVSK